MSQDAERQARLEAQCASKSRFPSEARAKIALDLIAERASKGQAKLPIPKSAYLCRNGRDHWHLTRQEEA